MFTDPEKNLKFFGLREDMIVADLGAGTGFYSIAAAKMVPQGRVYSIEVQKDYLTTVKNKALEEGLNNLECLWGNVEEIGGTKIRDGVVDKVIASNILFQIENKEKFVEEINRILKIGGQVLLIDWSEDIATFGDRQDLIVPKAKAQELFERKGFQLDRSIDAGEHHYGMIFEKK